MPEPVIFGMTTEIVAYVRSTNEQYPDGVLNPYYRLFLSAIPGTKLSESVLALLEEIGTFTSEVTSAYVGPSYTVLVCPSLVDPNKRVSIRLYEGYSESAPDPVKELFAILDEIPKPPEQLLKPTDAPPQPSPPTNTPARNGSGSRRLPFQQ